VSLDRDALQLRLRALFLGELDQHVQALNRGLVALEERPSGADTEELVNELFRSAHSLKGAAHAAGVPPVETVCHHLEDVLARLRDGSLSLGDADLQPLFRAVDAVVAAGRDLREGGDGSRLPVGEVVQELAAAATAGTRAVAPSPDATAMPAAGPALPRGGGVDVSSRAGRTGDGPAVRVPTARLEALLNQAGEVLLACRGAHELAVNVASANDVLARAADQGAAVREVGERLDELTRAAQAMDRLLSSAGHALAEGVRQAQVLPFAQACEGLERVCRDLARAGGKEARLQVVGGDVELDRSVLEAVREPLLHLVRNAVDHGIEAPEARAAAGKPPAGHVRVSASLQGGTAEVSVADDGRGVDSAALSAVAERRGLTAGEDDVLGLAFTPGVSTSPIITEVSGRGIGLDAVRARVESLGGSARISSTPGTGTEAVLVLPLTLSAVRVLLVAAGTEVVGFPSSSVSRLVRAALGDLRVVGDHPVLLLDGRPAPVLWLAHLLGVDGQPVPDKPFEGVLVGLPGSEALLAVGGLLAEEEVVMKPPGERLAGVPGLLGATVLASGRMAAILNPATIVRLGLGQAAPRASASPAAVQPARPTRVLLAEDTLTTRALERSILEAAGYEVRAAVDGVDAWQLLEEHGADIVVSDVNMPRMDGLALCQAVRASGRFREVPFVLVTSLATDEDRRRGVEAGADAYIVKSSFDQELLLDTIERLR
jgi:two-component system chemotaxis sensor kinase CheA